MTSDAIPSRVHDRDASSHPDLAGWRVVRKGLEARFRADHPSVIAAFVTAALALDTGGEVDVDVRNGSLVAIRLSSFEQMSLGDGDVTAAATLSARAAELGLVSDGVAIARTEVGIDALDIDLVRPFWAALLGYVDEPTPVGEQVTAIVDPDRMNAGVWFQQMDAPRPQRNRIHLDVNVPHDQAEARIAAALAAGGRLLDDSHARAFWVLADPEGNEACVCTWQDRG
ncbi:MAG: VOC family protein [Acidimicrobiales bacterium]